MRRVLGAVNPRALNAEALAIVMTAFAAIEGVWCDVLVGDTPSEADQPMLFYFDGADDEVTT